jgi:hypothetical protein
LRVTFPLHEINPEALDLFTLLWRARFETAAVRAAPRPGTVQAAE